MKVGLEKSLKSPCLFWKVCTNPGNAFYLLLLLLLHVGAYVIAVIEGKEEYDLLKDSLANVVCDVESLVNAACIAVDGIEVPIELYLGGDYKVSMPDLKCPSNILFFVQSNYLSDKYFYLCDCVYL